ncbi:HAMP domain-containing histidine kinase (plasmid) [Deinococcus sp. KNUC1210]|uniref:sensor histidine kinase n=1 Tax=Deinococcus sp. KNUC1210 TaxID=2917691 RepID=UPI001EF12717|nr:HAMP domain-containing sensor histidine kinase [Deinococcus sp. KNUC1210]ULH17013.1 HAMP domain-containing histidine kinase [Deinococcus sp. KNUC1210]
MCATHVRRPSGPQAWRPALSQATALSVTVFVVVLLLDTLTPARLVFGILFSAPIALSGLAGSPYATRLMIVLVMVGNVIAGSINAATTGGWNPYDIANRVLSLLAALLVGSLTLRFRAASNRAAQLELEEQRAVHEHALRQLLEAVSGPFDQAAFVERMAQAIRAFTGSRSVVVGGLQQATLRAPYAVSHGAHESEHGPPEHLPALNARLPAVYLTRPAGTGAVWGILGGEMLLARLPRPQQEDLLLIFDHPEIEVARLEEAIAVLGPQLERTHLQEEMQRQQARLEHHNTVIRDLVYAFSHDLRTPLMANALSMNNALKGAYGPLPEAYRETLTHGLHANQTLLDLAEKLLLVAKYEAGEPSPDPLPLDLRELALQVVAQVRPLAATQGIALETRAEVGLRVLGQKGELRRAIQNILDNAIKFSPPGGTVTLLLDRDTLGEQAELRIIDEGPGLSREGEARLFQRFRGGSGTSGLGGQGSSGLGLYLTRQVLQAHQGSVQYSRSPLGKTVFTLRLPVT